MAAGGYTLPLHDFPGGAANSTGAIVSDVASQVFGWRSYTNSSATSGSSYGARFQHYISGAAGSGSAVRGYALVKAVSATYLYGGEFTAEVMSTSSSDIATAGTAAGVRGVVSIGLNATGYTAALLANYDVATSKTASATKGSFIRCENLGAGTGCVNLLDIAVAKVTNDGTKLVSSNHDTISADTYVRIMINGTAHWLLASTHLPAGS
jgi:hypothetical protein